MIRVLACTPLPETAAGPRVVRVPAAAVAGAELALVASGLGQPLGLVSAPGQDAERLFVVEKKGRIRVLRGERIVGGSFLDLSSRVSSGSEQGLLGLAFHPGFARNGRLFVNYTDRRGDTRIVEIVVASPSSDRARVLRERDLLHVEQPYSNHNGGHLVFGPEGRLWIGLGDGGSAGDPRGNGQSRVSRLGKMLRIDVDASDPSPEIVQWGLRNPWRYAFDRETGDLYIGDVGQDRWEEIHVLPRGRQQGVNLGWNVLEGAHCFRSAACNPEGLVLPAVEYGHRAGCSVTGGVVYRGRALPALRGLYFYSDYCTSFLRSFRWNGEGKPVSEHWDWTEALDPRGRLSEVSSFGEDAQGEIYVMCLSGSIFKLRPVRR